jgi:polar amino acid transport system substrate-binding protein
MKNKSTLVLLAFIALILAGCGVKKAETINKFSDLDGKVIGMINSGAPTQSLTDLVAKYGIGAQPKEVLGFNNISDLITAVITGKIDAVPIMGFIADYYVKRNSNLKIIEAKTNVKGDIQMAVRFGEQQLKEDLDKAITTLQENGVLKKIADQWINNLPVANEPSINSIPRIDGAKTLYVGVSGNYVPLDYIAADGKPAGFNVALLNEIGKLINVNFELISVDSQAKFAALGSKKIDVVFCQAYNQKGSSLFKGLNNKYAMTNPYFTDKGMCLLVRK